MFKDLGYQILIKWQLWKVLVLIYPLIFLYGFWLLFTIAANPDQNSYDGSQLIHADVDSSLQSMLYQSHEAYYSELIAKKENTTLHFIKKLENLGLQVYYQESHKNIVARLKTKRSPDYECSLITFLYDEKKVRNEAFVLSLIRTLKSDQINYLSRDLIFVGYHADYKEYGQGIQGFLEEYINPQSVSFMPRSGTIRSAINIDLEDKFDSIALKVFGLNGRISDRDFFISINEIFDKQGIDYKFTETNYTWMSQLEKKLDRLIRQMWSFLQLKNFYELPKKRLLYFDQYFSHQIDMIEGDLNDAHSYLINYGIHAVTFRGYNSENKNDQSTLTSKLLLICEASIKALMANDEFIHSGSTLYLPLGRNTTITIQQYSYPYAVIMLAVAIHCIKIFYSRWHFNIYKEKKQELGQGYAMVIHKTFIEIFMGISLCLIPLIIKKLNLETQSYFQSYYLVLIAVIISYQLLLFCTRFWIFGKLTLPRQPNVFDILWAELVLGFSFAMMFGGIVHISLSSIIVLFIAPWFFFIQPLRPKPRFSILKDSLSYVINIGFLLIYFFIISSFGLDNIKQVYEQIVIDYNKVGVYVFYYINGVLIPSLIRLVYMLLF